MPTLELTDEQVIELVRQLPSARQAQVALMLAKAANAGRENRMAYAKEQIRRVCAERGLDWDAMSEDEREDFIQELVEED